MQPSKKHLGESFAMAAVAALAGLGMVTLAAFF